MTTLHIMMVWCNLITVNIAAGGVFLLHFLKSRQSNLFCNLWIRDSSITNTLTAESNWTALWFNKEELQEWIRNVCLSSWVCCWFSAAFCWTRRSHLKEGQGNTKGEKAVGKREGLSVQIWRKSLVLLLRFGYVMCDFKQCEWPFLI